MDLEKAKKEFISYTNNFDMSNRYIKGKVSHTLRVMELCGKISESLNLNKKQIELSKIIGILHDIARFEQMKQYGTFVDSLSFDHGDYGAKMLENEEFIRRFIDTNKYDNIIREAVRVHNKYKIPDDFKEDKLLYSRIVRDADKIDIMYENIDIYWEYKTEKFEKIKNAKPVSNEILDQVKNHIQVLRKPGNSENKLNSIVTTLSFVFDMNYKYSLNYVREHKYVDKIIEKFEFKNIETKTQMKEIGKIINNYLDEKVG